jgi:hypothetical protein
MAAWPAELWRWCILKQVRCLREETALQARAVYRVSEFSHTHLLAHLHPIVKVCIAFARRHLCVWIAQHCITEKIINGTQYGITRHGRNLVRLSAAQCARVA